MKKNVKIIRCDNAGENKMIEDNFMKNFKEIKFEFTSPGTPKQNHMVERGFATLYSRMRAILTHAGLYQKLKTGPWTKCVETVENIMVSPHKEKCTHENFYRKIPDYAKYLRSFG